MLPLRQLVRRLNLAIATVCFRPKLRSEGSPLFMINHRSSFICRCVYSLNPKTSLKVKPTYIIGQIIGSISDQLLAVFIRDRSSDLYAVMGVVEMYNR